MGVAKDKGIFAWWPALLWALVKLLFAVLPYKRVPSITTGYFDKVAHFIEYFILSVLVVRGLSNHSEHPFRDRVFSFTLILGGLYGIVLELMQHLVPGRHPSFGDAAANLAGVLVGLIIGKEVLWRK